MPVVSGGGHREGLAEEASVGGVAGDVEDGLREPLLAPDREKGHGSSQEEQDEAYSESDKESDDVELPPISFLELFFFADQVMPMQ